MASLEICSWKYMAEFSWFCRWALIFSISILNILVLCCGLLCAIRRGISFMILSMKGEEFCELGLLSRI